MQRPSTQLNMITFAIFSRFQRQLYDTAFTQVIGEATPENSGEDAD